jgi:DNA modification methylase
LTFRIFAPAEGERLNRIICGDALTELRKLPDKYADMALTSPPYYGLRDYLCDGQIGLEPSPDEYVERLTEVFHEVKRVLSDTGVLWLNITDSYAGRVAKSPKTWRDIKPKDLIGIPYLLAFALRADGWYLRSCVLWEKTNPKPESVRDRPTRSYEHVFLLAKSANYYYNKDAISEPVASGTNARRSRAVTAANKYAGGVPGQTAESLSKPRGRASAEEMAKLPETRNARDIWRIATGSRHSSGRFATFPVELARRCILAGCPVGGVVLDPFFGAGTTGVAALETERAYIGIELNPDFCQLAETRIQAWRQKTSCGNKILI